MPVKWMAIESLTDCIFSSQSDVWSYGVLTMEKPENAPNVFGEIMTNCWKMDPKERPTFQQLEDTISGYMTNLTLEYDSKRDLCSQ